VRAIRLKYDPKNLFRVNQNGKLTKEKSETVFRLTPLFAGGNFRLKAIAILFSLAGGN
jgi:hypothetical protein